MKESGPERETLRRPRTQSAKPGPDRTAPHRTARPRPAGAAGTRRGRAVQSSAVQSKAAQCSRPRAPPTMPFT